jgi:hypothetical protein
MEMPILSKSFFEIYKPDTGFFSKWQSFGKWSSVCVPVYEWQGALFIGCIELPDSEFYEEFSNTFPNFKAVAVMCDSSSLRDIWSTYSGSSDNSLLANAGVELSAPVNASADPTAGFETLLQDVPDDISEGISNDDEDSDGESLNLNFAPPDESSPAATAPVSTSTSSFNFGATDLMKPQTPAPAVTPIIETTTSNKPLPAPTLGKASVPPSKVERLNPNAFDLTSPGIRLPNANESGKNSIPPSFNPTPAPKAPTQTKDLSSQTKSGFGPIPTFDVPKKAQPQSAEVLYTKPGALSSNKDLINKQKAALESLGGAEPGMSAPVIKKHGLFPDSVFTELNYHFQKTMILLVEGDSVKPWKWDSHFHKGPAQIDQINLKNPSAFRIVMRTQKPYHGYVVSNEVTDKFFDDWNSSNTPEHLTVVPVVSKDNVVAMILSVGEKSSDNKNSLQLAEKVAREVSSQLENHPEILKAG